MEITLWGMDVNALEVCRVVVSFVLMVLFCCYLNSFSPPWSWFHFGGCTRLAALGWIQDSVERKNGGGGVFPKNEKWERLIIKKFFFSCFLNAEPIYSFRPFCKKYPAIMELYFLVATIMHSAVVIIGIPGNLLMITVYLRRKRTSYSVFVIWFAIIDLFLCLSISPIRVYYYITFGREESDAFCVYYGFAFLLEPNSSIFLSALLSFNRYVAVCKPHNRWLSKRASALSAAAAFGLSIATSAPVIPMFELVDYTPGRYFCNVPSRLQWSATIYVYSLAVITVLTAIFTLVMSALVLRRIRRLGQVGARMPAPRINVGRELPTAPSTRPGRGVHKETTKPFRTKVSVERHSLDIPSTSRITSANVSPLSQTSGPSPLNSQDINICTRVEVNSQMSTSQQSATGAHRQVNPCAPIGHRAKHKATKVHLTMITIYLVMWLANICILIMGTKPGFNRSASTFVKIMGRACSLNRICHFGISFAFHKTFRAECRQVITDNMVTRFISRVNNNQS